MKTRKKILIKRAPPVVLVFWPGLMKLLHRSGMAWLLSSCQAQCFHRAVFQQRWGTGTNYIPIPAFKVLFNTSLE